MSLKDLVLEIICALRVNKLRSALTVFGIVCGIASVTFLTTLITGFSDYMLHDFVSINDRTIAIKSEQPRSFSDNEVQRLKSYVPDARYSETSDLASIVIKTRKNNFNFSVADNNNDILRRAINTKIVQGRWFLDSELEGSSSGVIVTQRTLKILFGSEHESIEGKKLVIQGLPYSIIGVIENVNSGFDVIATHQVFKRIAPNAKHSNLYFVFDKNTDIEQAQSTVRNACELVFPQQEKGKVPVFTISSLLDSKKFVKSIQKVFTMIFTLVASVSLFVGGIGIMNMMLTNVNERLREIGLRKAVGARRQDISRQFLGESIALCLLGGLIGMLLGYAGAWIAAFIIELINETHITPRISLEVLELSLGVSLITGIIFGYYPARRAAKLDPVQALRAQ